MSLKKIDINELPDFGGRLMTLARNINIGSPILLAEALYENHRDLIEPGQRKNKNGKTVKDSQHDIAAITRMVQKHFGTEYAYDVQSKYLYAYSLLFNCSMDYLYGKTTITCCNLEIQELCEKMHIPEQVANNILESYDSDPNTFSHASWWMDLLSGEEFNKIPKAWLQYSMELQMYSDLNKKIEAIRNAEKLASDKTYRTMMEVRRISLEKMIPWIESRCQGAFLSLSRLWTDYTDRSSRSWVSSRHCDLEDNYFDHELEKIKVLEEYLKEDSDPIT